MNKKTVFLTGASGNMGYAGFKELYQRKDKFTLVLLSQVQLNAVYILYLDHNHHNKVIVIDYTS